MVIGLTESSWDGSSVPQFMSGPTAGLSVYSDAKIMALLKIGGWMIFTLLLVLAAIRFAIHVADKTFDKKPQKPVKKVEKEARKED